MEDFVINAEKRDEQGKGASRRLRRAGKFPAIVYGADKEPRTLAVNHNEMLLHLESEAIFSHVLTLAMPEGKEQVVLKDLQRHPSKPVVLHADFLRVSAKQKLTMPIPLHFINEDQCPGHTMSGGLIQHHLNELEVSCLPRDLPEYIEVDMGEAELGDTIHVSDVKLPAGVELTASHDPEDSVASVTMAQTMEEPEEEEAEAPEAAAEEAPEGEEESPGEGEGEGGEGEEKG